MPNSRRRTRVANAAARRHNKRRVANANAHRMVERAEQHVTQKLRVAERLYCPILVGAVGGSTLDSRTPCGGRLRPVKRAGTLVPDLFECRACGRTVEIARQAAAQPHQPPVDEADNLPTSTPVDSEIPSPAPGGLAAPAISEEVAAP